MALLKRIFTENLNGLVRRLPRSSQVGNVVKANEMFVDKSELAFRLMKTGRNVLALSPDGFGKTMLISVIKAIAENDEVVSRLKVAEDLPNGYRASPVISFDFSRTGDVKNGISTVINNELVPHAKRLGMNLINDDPVMNFYDVLRVYTKEISRPYVLVDGYDLPVWVQNIDLAKSNSYMLKSLITAIESSEQYIAFCMVAGVTRIDLTPLNSVQHHFQDLKTMEKYAELMGFTEPELMHYFADHIQLLTTKLNKSPSEIMEKLSKWYGGYKYNHTTEGIYSPKHVIQCFESEKIVKNLIGKHDEKLKKIMVDYDFIYANFGNYLETIDFENPSLKPFLWQKGFLTIENSENFPFCILKTSNRLADEELKQIEGMVMFGDNYNQAVEYLSKLKKLIKDFEIDEIVQSLTRLVKLSTRIIQDEKGFYKVLMRILHLAGVAVENQNQLGPNSQRIMLKYNEKDLVIDLTIGKNSNDFFKLTPRKPKLTGKESVFFLFNYAISEKGITLCRYTTSSPHEKRFKSQENSADLEELPSTLPHISFYNKFLSFFSSPSKKL